MAIIFNMEKRKINWLIWRKCCVMRHAWLCSALLILNVGGLLQDQYIGCFDNIDEASVGLRTEKSKSPDYQLTIEKCILKCRNQMQTYSALQNGTICHCFYAHGPQLPDDACNVTCAGNTLAYCGGTTIGDNKSSARTASAMYSVCPVGNYGSDCQKLCYCNRQIPCDRLTGDCHDGCDGNNTLRSCDNLTTLSERYIGCYRDSNDDRALPHRPYPSSFMNTPEMCIASCADANYSYAGVQFSDECYCGENYNKYKGLEESMCNRTCPVNRNAFCGGANANSIYSVCPVGRYGKGCRSKCNCLDNRRCVYLNGSCPLSQCQPGWTGNSCNIRDCRTYNGDCLQNEKCSTVDLMFSNMSVCRCSEGFQRRKMWEDCNDKDECSEIPLACGQNALKCTNTIGGYQCLCRTGETRFNISCMNVFEAMEQNNTWPIVGIVLASVLFVTLMILFAVKVHFYRLKRHNKEITTAESGCKTDEVEFRSELFAAIHAMGTMNTEENTYEMLNRIADDTSVYEQIAVTSSEMRG